MAVRPPPEEIRTLHRLLPPDAALTRPQTWHITLLFLGEVAEDRVGEVERILGAVTAPGRFELRLTGSGQFGRVAWVGVDGDLAVLRPFRERVREALAAGGFDSDERPFRPHLTVSYRGDEDLLRVLSDYSGTAWAVDEFALFRSVDGEYEEIRAWPTAGGR